MGQVAGRAPEPSLFRLDRASSREIKLRPRIDAPFTINSARLGRNIRRSINRSFAPRRSAMLTDMLNDRGGSGS